MDKINNQNILISFQKKLGYMRPGSIEICLVAYEWKPESYIPVQYGGLSLLRPGFEIRFWVGEDEKTTERTSRPGRLYFLRFWNSSFKNLQMKILSNLDTHARAIR